MIQAQKLAGDSGYNKQKKDTAIEGYVNGISIKNITATYATIKTESINGTVSQIYDLKFDYGQQWKWEGELRLNDKSGKMLFFRGLGHLLNFLDDNEWVLVNILYGERFGKSVELIIKKKTR